MDYLIDKYKRELKRMKIFTPILCILCLLYGIGSLSINDPHSDGFTAIVVAVISPFFVLVDRKIIKDRIEELEEMSSDPDINVTALIAKEKYVMMLRTEKINVVLMIAIFLAATIFLYSFTHIFLLSALISLVLCAVYVPSYIIVRCIAKHEAKKADELLNTPDNKTK